MNAVWSLTVWLLIDAPYPRCCYGLSCMTAATSFRHIFRHARQNTRSAESLQARHVAGRRQGALRVLLLSAYRHRLRRQYRDNQSARTPWSVNCLRCIEGSAWRDTRQGYRGQRNPGRRYAVTFSTPKQTRCKLHLQTGKVVVKPMLTAGKTKLTCSACPGSSRAHRP